MQVNPIIVAIINVISPRIPVKYVTIIIKKNNINTDIFTYGILCICLAMIFETIREIGMIIIVVMNIVAIIAIRLAVDS